MEPEDGSPTGSTWAPQAPPPSPSEAELIPGARVPYLSPQLPALPLGQFGDDVHHPVPSELLGCSPGKALGVELRGTTPRLAQATGKQEVALRWREAEPPAHFLSGLRKCCLRQRLPETGWGCLRSGVFLCPGKPRTTPHGALITSEF